ncbi:uncharacterized protein A1O9_11439 [Exophiala aquamarina CBS 119918]|uniref:Multifunctional methyltransferase subunit TRM112 n=1 Tax=Exophiala aquamarina CBS 119918 TaxID=1182545 RepID=A0A072NYC4_9EURO|nr:uncharacterized protein A1O9_11439 [Exophiala aquamarina CBS 119918]KEF52596.1 hypothetical protein A1O9_11439 [Exophiala aquamarina CBS 119918]
MKILTTNFLTCAVKTCKTSPLSFPLHFKDATLERTEIEFNPLFLRNVLPRVNWDALTTTATELGLQALVPEQNPIDVTGSSAAQTDASDQVLRQLHSLLLETAVMEGKLVCGNCGFEYPIKEGVGNFLLPAHLV